jgi:hypothetical protein
MNLLDPISKLTCCVAVLPGAKVTVNVPDEPAAIGAGNDPNWKALLGLFVAVCNTTSCLGSTALGLPLVSVKVTVEDEVVDTAPKLIAANSFG